MTIYLRLIYETVWMKKKKQETKADYHKHKYVIPRGNILHECWKEKKKKNGVVWKPSIQGQNKSKAGIHDFHTSLACICILHW